MFSDLSTISLIDFLHLNHNTLNSSVSYNKFCREINKRIKTGV